MLDRYFLQGMRVGVMGLGLSGVSVSRVLRGCGVEVWVWDDREERRKEAFEYGLTVRDLRQGENLVDLGMLVVSPGVSGENRVLVRARELSVRVVCDMDLLAYTRQRGARYLGVTGTNGKSTTTAAIGHILRCAQKRVEVGGNIGVPVFDLEYPEDGWYVLEVSSFQLALLSELRFDLGVFLNVSCDHLDRHGDMEGYVMAKSRIFMCGEGRQTAIIGMDDERSRMLYREVVVGGHWCVVGISGCRRVDGGVGVEDGVLFDGRGSLGGGLLDLRGHRTFFARHFWQDVAAAYAAVTEIGVSSGEAVEGLRSFVGLPHRLSMVGEIRGIRYINDSKATNMDAALLGLRSFGVVYWIVGGQMKYKTGEEFLRSLGILWSYRGCIHRAYLIGETEEYLALWMEGNGVLYRVCHTLECALMEATCDALGEGVLGGCILLSPGCASFDQYKNFEHRGDHFVALFGQLQKKYT